MTLEITDQYVEIRCCTCDILFLLPEYFKKQRLADCKDFWCPKGHPQHFGDETEEQKLRKRIVELEQIYADKCVECNQIILENQSLTKKKRKK